MTLRDSIIYLSPYIVATLFPFGLGIFVRARNHSSVGRSFAFMLFVQAVWAFTLLMEITGSTLAGKAFWDDLQLIPAGVGAAAAVNFVLHYIGRKNWHGTKLLLLSLVFSLLAWLFAATSSLHGLHRVNALVDFSIPFGELNYNVPLVLMVFLVPMYAISVYSVWLLLRQTMVAHATARLAALCAFSGLAFPLFGALQTILRIRILGRMEVTSLWFLVGDALIAYGIFRFRMAGVLPVARHTIVENLRDPVALINRRGIIVDHNVAFKRLFGNGSEQLLGKSARELCKVRMGALCSLIDQPFVDAELPLLEGPESPVYSIRKFPVIKHADNYVLVFRDISSLKRAEQKLRGLSVELEKKIEVRAKELMAEVSQRQETERRLEDINAEMRTTRKEIMLTLADIIETRGRESAGHVLRVSEYVRILCQLTGMSAEDSQFTGNAAALHDIGKISISEALLSGLDKDNSGAQELMQTHTAIGQQILGRMDDPLLKLASRIAAEHHEHWDGSGYPRGLAGVAISPEARILTACDILDSLIVSKRSPTGFSIAAIAGSLAGMRGSVLEPMLTDLVLRHLDEFLRVAENYSPVTVVQDGDFGSARKTVYRPEVQQ